MPDTEKDVTRVPPDCWPNCDYGVSCPHEWTILPPEGGDDV
jgi:hypothetical protein